MNRLFHKVRHTPLAITLVLLVPVTHVHAEDISGPGLYCPPAGTYERVLDQLSVTLDQVAKAQYAMQHTSGAAADISLGGAASALALASTQGAAARTKRLIGAAVRTKDDEDYQQLLGWFPFLNTALLTLPDDPEVRSAGTELGLAEDILQGDSKGDALKHLRTAAHYLSCDKLDIPIKQADDALTPLLIQVAQGHKAKPAAFDKVLSLLRTALSAAFEQSSSAGNP